MCSVALPSFFALTAIATLTGLYAVTNCSQTNDKPPENQICFSGLGCFDTGYPWQTLLRPIPPPQRPEKIPTRVFFYSRQNINNPNTIITYPDIRIGETSFDGQRPTLLVVHGYIRNATSNWMQVFKDVYLDNMDANVLLTDWSTGAFKDYLQSLSNTRVVGKILSRLLKLLMQKKNFRPELIHLVGHSLGAQICSFIAKDIPGIGRLTALDPAQPGYEGADPRTRLDKSDAAFVEVVHTDPKPFIPMLGFGMMGPHGHVDFYFNIALEQPGCILPDHMPKIASLADVAKFPVEFVYWKLLCSHERSHEYLIEAYNMSSNCIFWGHRASLTNAAMSVANLNKGIFANLKVHSETCTTLSCVPFGIDTIDTSLRGIFLVTTNNKEPYCVVEPGLLQESADYFKI